jgi:hypothetical protein
VRNIESKPKKQRLSRRAAYLERQRRIAEREAEKASKAAPASMRTPSPAFERLWDEIRIPPEDFPQVQAKVSTDWTSDSDRIFFEQHPHRTHRVRLASTAEIEINQTLSGHDQSLPPGQRHFCAIKQIAPGLRIRVYLHGTEAAGPDEPEWIAKLAFEASAGPPARQLEERMRAAAAKRDQ